MALPTIPWEAHFDGNAPETFDIMPCFLSSYLDRAAEQFGKRKAIVFENMNMTYAQLRDKAEQFAASLREHGWKTEIVSPSCCPICPRRLSPSGGYSRREALLS